MHPILHSRVGPDQFVNRVTRLREDVRFKNVGPEVLEMNEHDQDVQDLREDGFWFDWAFVEFARNGYCESEGFTLRAYLILSQYLYREPFS